jgi:hypothetical protein
MKKEPTMSEVKDKSIEDLLRRVQGLIDKGSRTENEFEARIFLAKADELMMKFSLDPNLVLDPNRPNAARPVFDSRPERRDVVILQDTVESEWYLNQALTRLFREVANHLFVRVADLNSKRAVVFGYDVDINFLEMFFLKLKLHMFSNLFTSIDPEKPWEDCVVGLKNMGHTWEQVHYKMRGSGHPTYPYRDQHWERRMGVKFTAVSKAHAELHGTPRNKSSNPDAWRADFVTGYISNIQSRLREMRAATMRDNPNLPDLVVGKKSKVEEAFYDEFPDMRPEPPHPEECQCDPCHWKKCKDHNCTRPFCKKMRAPVKASAYRGRNFNADAFGAGHRVGGTADLTDKGSIG